MLRSGPEGYAGTAELICAFDGPPFCQRRVELQGLPVSNLRSEGLGFRAQEYSTNIIEYKDPGRYIPMIFLL